MSKTAYMRGLQNFISDIRSAQNKEQEQRRVEKELLKIREKFIDDKALSGYDRRKYVWKLLYIYMLGYRIEFGYKQAADLIPQQKYKDKQVGYMACSLLLQENDEFLRLTLNAIHMDLTSRNEAFETLALSFIGNVGGSEMADALTQDVIKLLSGGAARPVVKKRAALALLRLIRKTNSEDQVVTADIFAPVVNTLLEERDLGLLLSVTTLLQGVCARNGAAGYEGAQQRLIKVLERLTLQREREVPAEYLYYGIPSPWLQCKCLRVLQYFPNPESSGERGALSTILHGIIDSVGVGETAKGANPNKANALHAILFEAISLALHLDPDTQLLTTCTSALGRFLSAKDANVRYLALDTLARLAQRPTSLEAIRHLQLTVLANLKDADVAIRKRASDLLFSLCDASCVQPLVTELLQYLGAVDFSMREEVVLKIAILAEKFAPSVDWYVEVALQLLEKAGDFVSEDLWHRVVQLVTNTPAMQPCAARSTVAVLRRGAAHESLVCSAAYLLGEFGSLVADQAPLAEQFRLLHALFPPATPATKGLLLTAFIKLYLADPGNAALRNEVVTLFERNQKFMDAELQQRAVEYLRLTASPSAARYFLPMPKWQEGGESSLLHRLQHLQGGSANTAAAGGSGGLDISRSSAGGSLTLGTQGSGAALLPAGASGPVSPRLMLGSPSAAHAPPSKDPLWASGSGPQPSPRSAASGAPLMSQGFTSSAPNPTPPGHPTKPSDPVDLLGDLLSDTLLTPAPAPAPPLPTYPAAAQGLAPPPQQPAPPQHHQQPQQQHYGAAVHHLPPPPQLTGAAAQPYPEQQQQQYTGHTAAPPPPQPHYPQHGQPPLQQPQQPPAYPPPQLTGSNPFAAGVQPQYYPPPPPLQQGQQGPPPPLQQYPHPNTYPAQPQPQPQYMASPTQPASYTPQLQTAPSASQPQPYPGPLPSGYPPAPQLTPTASYASNGQPGLPGPGAYAGSTGSNGLALPSPDAPLPAMPPPSGVTYEAARPLGSLEHWYSQLLVKERGILYEDPHLQVGVQNRYSRSTGQLVLFLGNKHPEASLLPLQLRLLGPVPGLSITVGPAPQSLTPKQQVQVVLQLVAAAPFQGPPCLQLTYAVAGTAPVAVELRLPVLAHKFVVPEPAIPKEMFFEQWKASSTPPYKCQEMVERASSASIATVGAVTRLANLGVEHGYLDPSPCNEAGAGYFCYASNAGEQTVLVMARIEGNPQNMAQFRVTVVSQAPQVSAQLKDLIVSHLKLAPT